MSSYPPVNLCQDQFTKLTNIFCGEVEKPIGAQKQVFDTASLPRKLDSEAAAKNQSVTLQQRISESVDEGKAHRRSSTNERHASPFQSEMTKSTVRIFVEVLNRAAMLGTSSGL